MIIPGEKKKIREEIQRRERRKGKLSEKEKKAIRRKIHKQQKRKIVYTAMLATLGIGATKLAVDEIKFLNEAQEVATSNKTKKEEFHQMYEEEIQESDIEKEVKALRNKDEILSFMKDEIVEDYEKNTGDTEITTEDIKIYFENQNSIFIDDNTGEAITHGEAPEATKQNLANKGITFHEYWPENNGIITVYKVQKQEEVLGCTALLNGNPTKVKLGDQYENEYNYDLSKMAKVLSTGFNCIHEMERGDETGTFWAKKDLIKAVEELEQPQIIQETEQEVQQETEQDYEIDN